MPDRIELFPANQVVGVFRGFREGGMEFHADLALPYRSDFQNIPMHGQFLLVQLETPDEAVLGRITSLSSEGKLSSSSGEEFNIRAMRESRPVPEGIREDYLKYRVNIRVLGVLRQDNAGRLTFVPSHRRLPHVGSPVAFASPAVLREVGGHNDEGAELGFLALGEYVYAAGDDRLQPEPWMQVKEPSVVVKFPIESLVARRSFVFARAGFGKSNLNKLLFADLYAQTPTIEKRGGRRVPVGTLLFDPDGEYFWPDDKGRPGLCDVEHLQDRIVVFTPRNGPSPFYQSFVAGGIKLDIRRLRPSDVISIALSPEKQDQQNVRKLKGLNQADWSRLVDLIDDSGNSANIQQVSDILGLHAGQQEVEALAARANMTALVRMLHDRGSQLMDMLLEALAAGKLCVVDVSKLRGGASLVLSGLILRKIFDRNQEEFTKAQPQTIPVIAVVEEAQSVLNAKASGAEPYIEWVKEGRKYDLGAVLITQQPGSISSEILSQGDNWFIFHLLSTGDLHNLRSANAHFSEDLLAALLNEPIPGQGVFWSSVGGRPYPVPVRVLSFEAENPRLDQGYDRAGVDTYASRLRQKYSASVADAVRAAAAPEPDTEEAHALVAVADSPARDDDGPALDSRPADPLTLYKKRAIEALRNNASFRESMASRGIPWGTVKGILRDALPETVSDRDDLAFRLVPEAVSELLEGPQGTAWDTERRATRDGRQVTFVVKRDRSTN
jgi:DNA helicase HerA-like ATPase